MVSNAVSGETYGGRPVYDTDAVVEATATTTEASADFACKRIVLLANDGGSDITFGFDRPTTEPGALTLKPGEIVTDLPLLCQELYYKTASGSSPFRAWGLWG